MYAKCSVNTSTNIALIWNLLVEADSYWVTNRWAKSLGYSRYVPSTNEQAILGGMEPCGMRFYLSTQNRLQLKMLYFWNLLLIFLGHDWPLVTQTMGEKTWAWGTCDIIKFSHVCQCGKGPRVRPPSLSLCTHMDTWDQNPWFQMAHEHQMKLAQM